MPCDILNELIHIGTLVSIRMGFSKEIQDQQKYVGIQVGI